MSARTKHRPNRQTRFPGPGAARPGVGPGPEGATPPLLIGGVRQHICKGDDRFSLIGAGIDFLTVTVPGGEARDLIERTHFSSSGNPRPGFGSSEERLVLGGTAWRRWDPHQPSKDFGDDYESWEASGVASIDLARMALGITSRATRQDYAFDFQCSPDLMPRDLLPIIRPHLETIGVEPHFAGPESSCTVYIGSMSSSRRVKIYRRDLKDPALLLDGFPPQLRIEVTLADDLGRALWARRKSHGSDGLGVAATHIAHMIGWSVYDDAEPVPEPAEASEDADAAQMLLTFIEQHSSMLSLLADAGVDIIRLADARIAVLSRAGRDRHRKRAEKFSQIHPEEVARIVLNRIRVANPIPASSSPVL